MPEIKYQHAIIEGAEGRIISINEVTKENRQQYKFRCIGCGNELLPRAIDSKYRKPHFYHKEIVNCSGETYLHKLAKHIIKQKFDHESTFKVEYYVTKKCDNDECKYRNPWCSEENTSYKIDLKKYYDTCKEEATVKDAVTGKEYIADILLTSSRNSNIPPTLIEIRVSHPCDDDKRNSGYRIIEVRIKSEDDLINMWKEDFWREEHYIRKKDRKIEFYSFKREMKIKKHTKLKRYIFRPQQTPLGYVTEVDCSQAQYKLRIDSQTELNMVYVRNYGVDDIWVPLLWMAKHKGLRRCNMCKFYYATQYEDYAKCRLSKYGKPEHPSMDEAERCQSYSLQSAIFNFYNQEDLHVEEVTLLPPSIKPEYKVILTASRSFDDYALFKEKFLYYLSDKIRTHSLVIITTSMVANWLTDALSKEIDFIRKPHYAEWQQFGQEAINISNNEITNYADALIAFWDGRSSGIRDLIAKAHNKGLKVKVIKSVQNYTSSNSISNLKTPPKEENE